VGLTGMDPGCCCGGCACSTTICISECSGNLKFTTATVTVGTLPSQAVDGTTGCATFCLDSIGGAGSHTVTVANSGTTCFSSTETLACNGTKNIDVTGSCSCVPSATSYHGTWVFTFNGSGPITCNFLIDPTGSGTCFAIGSFQFTFALSCFVNVNGCGTFPLKNTSTCSPFKYIYDISFGPGCGAFPGDTIVGTLTVTP
jgi:hypothetical protein